MHLRLIDGPCLARFGNNLTAFHLVAALHEQLVVVRVGSYPTVVVTKQHEIAVAFEFIAGVRDDARLRSMNFCAKRHGEIDAVVMRTVGTSTESGNDAARRRPTQLDAVGNGGCRSWSRQGNLFSTFGASAFAGATSAAGGALAGGSDDATEGAGAAAAAGAASVALPATVRAATRRSLLMIVGRVESDCP